MSDPALPTRGQRIAFTGDGIVLGVNGLGSISVMTAYGRALIPVGVDWLPLTPAGEEPPAGTVYEEGQVL